jgi:hypothetical protein
LKIKATGGGLYPSLSENIFSVMASGNAIRTNLLMNNHPVFMPVRTSGGQIDESKYIYRAIDFSDTADTG